MSYVLRLGDNALVTGQRMTERVTGEPELEEELANANFALDYIGQARLYYGYAGELEGEGRTEDDFAFLRDSQAFGNFLIAEQPNGHFGDAIVRQVLFETFYSCNWRRWKTAATDALRKSRSARRGRSAITCDMPRSGSSGSATARRKAMAACRTR